MKYQNLKTSEIVDALVWDGNSTIFYAWEEKFRLPFTYKDFPLLRITNSPRESKFLFLAKIGDCVLLHKDGFVSVCSEQELKENYKILG